MSDLIGNLRALRFVAAALALTLLVASHAAFAPQRTKACPQPYGYEYHIRYYSDATYTQIVGFCQGDSCTGWEYCDGQRTEHLISNTNTIACC